jgi:diguanylate cyclase (GGDEF)-like protein
MNWTATGYGGVLRTLPGQLLPTWTELQDLVSARYHPPAVVAERSQLIIVRVRQIAAVFALLTLAWIIIDAASLPDALWIRLAVGRAVASAAFALLAATPFEAGPTTAPHRALALLVAVPLVFFLYADSVFASAAAAPPVTAITAYCYTPFIVAAGLSIFPLTALEAAAFGAAPLFAMAAAIAVWPSLLDDQSPVAMVWRVALIVGISGLAGLSQLRFLLQLTDQATRDGLTGLLVRKVGAELVDHYFAYSVRSDTPLTLLFIDLDNFKSVNDSFGHEAGDAVLQVVGATLKRAFRQQDILVRWGGEEFVVALPGTARADAEAKLRQLASLGIGHRPDGRAMTASIGVAERIGDQAGDAEVLIGLADRRMYAAKQAGRNRYVSETAATPWIDR